MIDTHRVVDREAVERDYDLRVWRVDREVAKIENALFYARVEVAQRFGVNPRARWVEYLHRVERGLIQNGVCR